MSTTFTTTQAILTPFAVMSTSSGEVVVKRRVEYAVYFSACLKKNLERSFKPLGSYELSLFPTDIGKNPGKLGDDDETQVVAEKI